MPSLPLNCQWSLAASGLFFALLLAPAGAADQKSSCDLRAGDDGLKPTSSIARTDAAIAEALKRGSTTAGTRAEIIMQGVFGPCYSASARPNHFEIVWMRLEHEPNDRSKDAATALVAVSRIVKQFKEHKIPLEARPINVFYSRFIARDTIMYTVHWPASIINRAVAAPEKAEELLRNGYKVADGDEPPLTWMEPKLR